MLRDFRAPAGLTSEEVDANGDGEVLAVLDLRVDESLVAAGLAREMVNRWGSTLQRTLVCASEVVPCTSLVLGEALWWQGWREGWSTRGCHPGAAPMAQAVGCNVRGTAACPSS